MTKAAEDFAAFQDLKDLTQATDDQLRDMLRLGCSELPIANFEDAMSEALLRLFFHLTGVLWVRGWQQGARPTTLGADVQYGSIWLRQLAPAGAPVVIQNEVEGQADLCELIAQNTRYEFQLDVYRDAPQASAIDVLNRLRLSIQHPRSQFALTERCLAYRGNPIDGINNIPMPLVDNTFESRATGTLTIYARPVSSQRVPTFAVPDWDIDCTGIEFPDPEPPVLC